MLYVTRKAVIKKGLKSLCMTNLNKLVPLEAGATADQYKVGLKDQLYTTIHSYPCGSDLLQDVSASIGGAPGITEWFDEYESCYRLQCGSLVPFMWFGYRCLSLALSPSLSLSGVLDKAKAWAAVRMTYSCSQMFDSTWICTWNQILFLQTEAEWGRCRMVRWWFLTIQSIVTLSQGWRSGFLETFAKRSEYLLITCIYILCIYLEQLMILWAAAVYDVFWRRFSLSFSTSSAALSWSYTQFSFIFT